MQCTNCGNTLQPGAAFCNNCGTPVARPQQPEYGETIQAPSGYAPQGYPPGATVFREARSDPTSLAPGIVVALVSILIMSLGTWLWANFKFGDTGFDNGRFFLRSVIIGTLLGLGSWAGWVAIAGFMLQQVFK